MRWVIVPGLLLWVGLEYIRSKYWLLNNLFGLFFTINAVKSANIKSFVIAVPTLWLLFFYDMYWVYHSDVMVTVAKNI
jgi:minor histocompatibility antigen H13